MIVMCLYFNHSIIVSIERNNECPLLLFQGYHTGVLAVCEIDSVSEPLVLSISSKVAGLTITYSVEGQTEECNNSRWVDL